MTTPDLTRLAEIEARLEKATPGPWFLFTGEKVVQVSANPDAGRDLGAVVNWTGFDASGFPITRQKANAALIAHAPGDLRWLLSEVRRLTEELARLRPPGETAQQVTPRHALARIAALVRDDAWAISFLSLGGYREALSSEISRLRAGWLDQEPSVSPSVPKEEDKP